MTPTTVLHWAWCRSRLEDLGRVECSQHVPRARAGGARGRSLARLIGRRISRSSTTLYLYIRCDIRQHRSVIGLATNVTLNRDSPDYEWVDEGRVETHEGEITTRSTQRVLDDEGTPWMCREPLERIRCAVSTRNGSLPSRMIRSTRGQPSRSPRAVEAPFIIQTGASIICSSRLTSAVAA